MRGYIDRTLDDDYPHNTRDPIPLDIIPPTIALRFQFTPNIFTTLSGIPSHHFSDYNRSQTHRNLFAQLQTILGTNTHSFKGVDVSLAYNSPESLCIDYTCPVLKQNFTAYAGTTASRFTFGASLLTNQIKQSLTAQLEIDSNQIDNLYDKHYNEEKDLTVPEAAYMNMLKSIEDINTPGLQPDPTWSILAEFDNGLWLTLNLLINQCPCGVEHITMLNHTNPVTAPQFSEAISTDVVISLLESMLIELITRTNVSHSKLMGIKLLMDQFICLHHTKAEREDDNGRFTK